MKTQYFRKPKRFITPAQGIAAAIAAGVLFILLGIRLLFPGFFVTVFSPLWHLGNVLSGAAALEESAEANRARLDSLQAENETLRNENRLLKANAEIDHSAQGIEAGVIARPPLAPYDVLIVAAGSEDGVYEGMRVFSRHIPVGVVESVAAESARVVLFSSSGRMTDGWVGEKRHPITLRGAGAGTFEADIARESGVVEGDQVYLPGALAYPVGVVVKVESEPSSPRATVSIRPFANPFTMTSVSILASPSPR